MNAPRPLVSVVVIGRNEGLRLEACLLSIRAARWHVPYEVVYADSGSTDGSVQVARTHGALARVIEPPYSAAAARNAGLAAASAPFILFLDGDTELHPEFPARALQALVEGDPRIACVWGHRRESQPEQSLYTRALDLDWIFPAGDTLFCGGDALFRREALDEAGGFDATLIAGEEPDLCRRLRALAWRVSHIDAPMTRHDLGIRRFSQYWRRSVRAGHAYASVARRFAGTADPLWLAESRRNQAHVAVLAGLLALPLAGAAVAWQAALAASALSLLALAVLVARTAARQAWKTGSSFDLLVYAVHSHLQQLPVFVGQLQFWLRSRALAPRALIEYR